VAQFAAEDRAEAQIAGNQSGESRNSMVTANSLSDRARELEAAADAAELHEAAMMAGHGERIVAVFEAVFAALGLPVPVSVLECALRGEPIGEELAVGERELVLRGVRQVVERELETARFEVSAPAAEREPTPEVVEAEVVNSGEVIEPVGPDDGLPSWESLPPEWKKRHVSNPTLARHEYSMALKRGENDRRRSGMPTRRSRHVIPRHPGV
jgi:hypothetical protein